VRCRNDIRQNDARALRTATRHFSLTELDKETAAAILYDAGFTATDIIEEIDDVLQKLNSTTPGVAV
jgi:hypothetical protein